MTEFAHLLKIQTDKCPSALGYVRSRKYKAFLELFIPTPPAPHGDCWHSALIGKLQMKVLCYRLGTSNNTQPNVTASLNKIHENCYFQTYISTGKELKTQMAFFLPPSINNGNSMPFHRPRQRFQTWLSVTSASLKDPPVDIFPIN